MFSQHPSTHAYAMHAQQQHVESVQDKQTEANIPNTPNKAHHTHHGAPSSCGTPSQTLHASPAASAPAVQPVAVVQPTPVVNYELANNTASSTLHTLQVPANLGLSPVRCCAWAARVSPQYSSQQQLQQDAAVGLAYLLMQQAAHNTPSAPPPVIAPPIPAPTPVFVGTTPVQSFWIDNQHCDWCGNPVPRAGGDAPSAVTLRALATATYSMMQQLDHSGSAAGQVHIETPVLCPNCAPMLRTIVRISRSLMLHHCGHVRP